MCVWWIWKAPNDRLIPDTQGATQPLHQKDQIKLTVLGWAKSVRFLDFQYEPKKYVQESQG